MKWYKDAAPISYVLVLWGCNGYIKVYWFYGGTLIWLHGMGMYWLYSDVNLAWEYPGYMELY